jgi:hypothetical protein
LSEIVFVKGSDFFFHPFVCDILVGARFVCAIVAQSIPDYSHQFAQFANISPHKNNFNIFHLDMKNTSTIFFVLHKTNPTCSQFLSFFAARWIAMVASKRRLRTGNRKKTFARKQHVGRKILSTSPVHSFQTDVLDHAETEPRAYCHVVPVVQLVTKHFQIKPNKLQIWDSYFCKGTMVKHLADLGFPSVRNFNEDFYKVQQTGVPESGQTT